MEKGKNGWGTEKLPTSKLSFGGKIRVEEGIRINRGEDGRQTNERDSQPQRKRYSNRVVKGV